MERPAPNSQRRFPLAIVAAMNESSTVVRAAVEDDVPTIASMIHSLAEYEKLLDELELSEERLREHLFGARRYAEAVIAEHGAKPVGYALYFHTYSTFLAKPGLWLEDLFVMPAMRRHGIGNALLRHVASVAVERGCGRLEWSVLDWNQPALGLYRAAGAGIVEGWSICRLAGEPLQRLAADGLAVAG